MEEDARVEAILVSKEAERIRVEAKKIADRLEEETRWRAKARGKQLFKFVGEVMMRVASHENLAQTDDRGEEEGEVGEENEEEKSGKDDSKSPHKEPSAGVKDPVAVTTKDGDGCVDPSQPEITVPSPEKTRKAAKNESKDGVDDNDKVEIPNRDDATKLANKDELERLAKIDTTPKKKKLTPEEEEDEKMRKIIEGGAEGDDDDSLPGTVIPDRDGTKLASKEELDKLASIDTRLSPKKLTPEEEEDEKMRKIIAGGELRK